MASDRWDLRYAVVIEGRARRSVDGVASVGEIVEKIGTSQSNVSQHLDQLRNKNIVKSRRDANRIYYCVRNENLLELIGTMRNVLCRTNLDDMSPPED